MLRLSVLISTISSHLSILTPQQYPVVKGVCYLFSCQYTQIEPPTSPRWMLARQDIQFYTIKGNGISANRNHAIARCQTTLAIIGDDDVFYSAKNLYKAIELMDKHPNVDIACLRATDMKGLFIKNYASQPYLYVKRPKGTYISSIELLLRISPRIPQFDLRFGLGSPYLGCGEEEIFLHDSIKKGLIVKYYPQTLCRTRETFTTGSHFGTNAAVRRAKGAVFAYIYSPIGALLRIVKTAIFISHPKIRLLAIKDMLAGALYLIHTSHTGAPYI